MSAGPQQGVTHWHQRRIDVGERIRIHDLAVPTAYSEITTYLEAAGETYWVHVVDQAGLSSHDLFLYRDNFAGQTVLLLPRTGANPSTLELPDGLGGPDRGIWVPGAAIVVGTYMVSGMVTAGYGLADPGVSCLAGWDDAGGQLDWITIGTNLSLAGGVLSCTVAPYTDEQAQDAVGAILVPGELLYVAGPNAIGLAETAVVAGAYTSADITVDQFGRITAAANGAAGGYTDNQAQNAVEALLGDTATIAWTLVPNTSFEAEIVDDSVANGKLSEVPAWTIKCRNTGSTGNPQDVGQADITEEATPAAGDFAFGFSAAGLLRLFDLGNLPSAGVIVDRDYATYSTHAALTVVIPDDDTIPQIGEGTQVASVANIPKLATNRVRLRVTGFGACSSGFSYIVAIFIDSTASAIASVVITPPGQTYAAPFALEHELVPGDTSAHTYSVRAGPGSGTCWLNGISVGRRMGGSAHVTVVLEEIEP